MRSAQNEHTQGQARPGLQRARADSAQVATDAELGRAMFDASPMGTATALPDGRLVSVNPALCRLLGFDEPSLLVHNLAELIHEEDRHLCARLDAIEGLTELLPLRMLKRDDAVVRVGLRVVGLRGSSAFVLMFIDQTEVHELAAKLVHADRMATVGALASGVVHELNNPLAFVASNAALALEELGRAPKPTARSKTIASMMQSVLDGAERVRTIARSFGVFARKDPERRTPVDVHRALDTACLLSAHHVTQKATIKRDFLTDIPLVNADETQLVQVFVNLIVNAADAMPAGRCEENVITLRTSWADDDSVVIEVIDNGVGMPEPIRNRMFEPFFTTKGPGAGTGLGLSVSKQIITSHGGTIEVQSKLGRGSTFRIVLPSQASTDHDQAAPTTQPSAHAAVRPNAPKRVLVIDDDAQIISVMKRIIERDHECIAVASGRAALSKIAAGERFDAILCDITMPDIPGDQVLRQLQELAPDQANRLAFLTGSVRRSSPSTRADHVPVLQKPFRLEMVRALVADLITR